ncbi:hypothetical protein [Roseomonas sp. BN140053]|uniref:arylmalonate decarboxylase n=1 Tax=Roseomonas sp. BN140053 TaxID=3391898 RepID=UPI0039E952D5
MPVVGLIVPPAAGEVPPEPPAMYPSGLRFVATGLALPHLTPEGYAAVIGGVEGAARRLAAQGAAAVALMGTSLSFFRGAAFNAELTRRIVAATGLPATTMSTAVVQALRVLGARRLAIGTAYSDTVNRQLAGFLEESGFETAGIVSLGLEDVAAIHAVTPDRLLRLGEDAAAAVPGAEALLISCGGLRTLELTPVLEARLGLPVVSSATAGAWAAARLVGHSGRVAGFGRLLEGSPPAG